MFAEIDPLLGIKWTNFAKIVNNQAIALARKAQYDSKDKLRASLLFLQCDAGVQCIKAVTQKLAELLRDHL